jgi:ferritin-like metal-binding protein YciE
LTEKDPAAAREGLQRVVESVVLKPGDEFEATLALGNSTAALASGPCRRLSGCGGLPLPSTNRSFDKMLPQMEKIRAQEKEHEEFLETCIRQLGGDAKHMTEMAILSEREATGIEKVIKKDPELPHLLHALLASEHVDTAGWDLLAALADEAGDGDAEGEFRKRLQEEERHLAFLREALRTFSAHELLGKDLELPTGGDRTIP